MIEFRWTQSSEKAAQLIAVGRLTYKQVAEAVGVTRQTLWNWRNDEAFQTRVDGIQAEIREEVRRIGLAQLHIRVQELDDRWNRMRQVIEARAEDPTMAEVPGGSTGLIVRTQKAIGSGGNRRVVEEFAVDTGLLKSLLDHEKQAAQELGQWSGKAGSKVRGERECVWSPFDPRGLVVIRPHSETNQADYVCD